MHLFAIMCKYISILLLQSCPAKEMLGRRFCPCSPDAGPSHSLCQELLRMNGTGKAGEEMMVRSGKGRRHFCPVSDSTRPGVLHPGALSAFFCTRSSLCLCPPHPPPPKVAPLFLPGPLKWIGGDPTSMAAIRKGQEGRERALPQLCSPADRKTCPGKHRKARQTEHSAAPGASLCSQPLGFEW